VQQAFEYLSQHLPCLKTFETYCMNIIWLVSWNGWNDDFYYYFHHFLSFIFGMWGGALYPLQVCETGTQTWMIVHYVDPGCWSLGRSTVPLFCVKSS
jgi:hypothetical protein